MRDESPEEMLARAGVTEMPLTDSPKRNTGNSGDGARQKTPRFPLVAFDNVLMSSTSFYLVKNLIPRSGLVVVYGSPKCGKSFWIFDLLMHVTRGWEYRGLRVKAGPVVYCALEGQKGFTRRIEAFRNKYPKAKGAPMSFMFTPLDLIKDHKALIESIRAQLPESVSPAVVTLDTLNRSLVGSESKDEDMAAYVRAADAIRDAFDCVVVIIHHCGHGADRPRGHSSLLGAADVLIVVKRDAADNIVATVENAKDGEAGLEIISRLVRVDIGQDEDDDTITSGVIEPVGEPAAKKDVARAPRLTKAAKNALSALHMAVDEIGETAPTSNHIPDGSRIVTVKQWRDYAFRTGISTSDEDHAKRAAFNRASEALLEARKIGIWEPHVWIVF
jgi:hypothetical protein